MTTRPPPPPPIGDDRNDFLGRVSAALGNSTRPRAPAPPPPLEFDRSIARVVNEIEPLVPAFSRNATAVGMAVRSIVHADLSRAVIEILDRADARSVAIGSFEGIGGLAATVSEGSRRVLVGDDATVAALFDVDAGITGVEAAIAETGSLVCWSGPERGRGPSLVVPIHIAVVHASRIVPDLLDYWDRFAKESRSSLPSSVVLISGPSKTADIEGVLITGVHGPREVHVLVITDR